MFFSCFLLLYSQPFLLSLPLPSSSSFMFCGRVLFSSYLFSHSFLLQSSSLLMLFFVSPLSLSQVLRLRLFAFLLFPIVFLLSLILFFWNSHFCFYSNPVLCSSPIFSSHSLVPSFSHYDLLPFLFSHFILFPAFSSLIFLFSHSFLSFRLFWHFCQCVCFGLDSYCFWLFLMHFVCTCHAFCMHFLWIFYALLMQFICTF